MFRGHKMLTGVGFKATVLAVLALGLLALPAVSAARTTSRAHAAPLVKAEPIIVEIGPFKAAHGYQFDLVVSSCAGTSKGTEISYVKGSEANNIDYSYSGSATCTAAKNLKQGKLSISWPGIATANLKVAAAGASKRGVVPRGCKGGGGTSREVVLKGSIDVTASKYFGTLKSKQIKGYISRLGNLSCGSESLPKSTDLDASFGSDLFVDASRYKKSSQVFIGDTFAPASGVTGNLFLDITGTAKLFDINKTTATLTDAKPFATGKLVATKLPACIGDTSTALNVSLSGSVTIDSPVLGAIVLNPAAATFAYIGATSAKLPADCDGYGAMPLTPSVDNECSDATVPCSISEGFGTDTFDDDSNPGTQTVISETINFGDGTTGTFTDGTASHAYAAPGDYTATVTIETSNGQTQTVTTPVYIGS
jgi:hypothetical protein